MNVQSQEVLYQRNPDTNGQLWSASPTWMACRHCGQRVPTSMSHTQCMQQMSFPRKRPVLLQSRSMLPLIDFPRVRFRVAVSSTFHFQKQVWMMSEAKHSASICICTSGVEDRLLLIAEFEARQPSSYLLNGVCCLIQWPSGQIQTIQSMLWSWQTAPAGLWTPRNCIYGGNRQCAVLVLLE